MSEVTVGRIVHYTLDTGPKAGEVRPAIVVNTWGGSDHIQLQVFTDSDENAHHNDALPQVMWKTSVAQSESGGPEPGRWHWPARA